MALPAGFVPFDERLEIPPITPPQDPTDIPKLGDDVDDELPPPSLPVGFELSDAPPPSFTDKAGAVLKGAARGFADVLPVAGAGIGAGVGAMAGAPTGPGALATGTAGLVLGGAIGVSAKSAIEDFIDIPAIEDVPEALRPFMFAGEAVGASIPMAGGPFALARVGFSTGGRFLDRVIQTVMRRPKTVALGETVAAISSGVGEGIAESAAPGKTGIRIASGVAGGVFAPGQLLVSSVKASSSAFRRMSASLSRSGRESAAATELQRLVESFGGDANAISKQVSKLLLEFPVGATPTAGQLTGNPVLMALETELSRRNLQFGRDAQKQAQSSLTILRRTADALSSSAKPEDLADAARLRQLYFEDLITQRVAVAEQKAVEAAERIGASTPESASELSRTASEILDASLVAARDEEKRLYALVKDAPADTESILATVDRIKANDLLPDEDLPVLVARFKTRMEKAAEEDLIGDAAPSSIAELRLFRTRMLDEARKASAGGDRSQARIFGKLAEAALDDLDKVTDPDGALDIARRYSKALNDVYTRTFVGDAQSVASSGAQRLPPELLLRRAAGAGQEVGALRLSELKRAVEFSTPGAADELLSVQEQFLRTAAEALIDPTTGQVSARRLATFRRRNSEILQSFPEFSNNLESAEVAQRFFSQVTADTKKASSAISRRAAFAKVAQTENPAQAVSKVLSGPKPQEEFRQLAIVARRDSEAAVAGLQRSVLDDAFQRAGGDTDAFSFERFRSSLFEPRRSGGVSAVELMKRTGVIDSATASRLETIIDKAFKVDAAIRSGDGLDKLLENESAIFDLVLRISGARAGASVAKIAGSPSGASLIAASSGSRFARQILDKVPAGRAQDVLIEAAKNPELMAALLKRSAKQSARVAIGLKLNAFLFQLGLVRAPEDIAQDQEQQL